LKRRASRDLAEGYIVDEAVAIDASSDEVWDQASSKIKNGNRS
jgi:hypothetical protein